MRSSKRKSGLKKQSVKSGAAVSVIALALGGFAIMPGGHAREQQCDPARTDG